MLIIARILRSGGRFAHPYVKTPSWILTMSHNSHAHLGWLEIFLSARLKRVRVKVRVRVRVRGLLLRLGLGLGLGGYC
jgi:hypothetical protein